VLKANPGGTNFTDAAGRPLTTIAGSSGMELQMVGLGAPDAYAHGTDLMLDFPVVKEVRLLSDSQGVASLAVGLSGNACPRISTLNGPPRLVVDFPTP
jgi:hypothetical protein